MSRQRTKITSPDHERVSSLLKTVTSARDKERLIVAKMALRGDYTLQMMADAVGRRRSTIQIWLDTFTSSGVDGLLQRDTSPGSPPALCAEVKEQVELKLSEGAWRTAGQFRQWLQEEHQITLSLSGSYYWLGKCEGRLKAPRPCHRKQKPGAILEFKMSGWEEQLQTLKIPMGQPVRFWVMDESRFGLHSIVRHGWGLRGKRVIKTFQQKFAWDYVYGALDLLSGEPVCCFVPTVSCDAVWEFLRQLVRTDPDAHHVVLWDGAGFDSPCRAHPAGCLSAV